MTVGNFKGVQYEPDAAALLRAIATHPDDDTPRLVFADLLEENGDAGWAELIRGQCELARLECSDPRDGPLSERMDALLEEYGPRWRAQLPRIPGLEWSDCPTRGFFEEVTVTDARALRDHGDTIRASSPVTRLRINSPASLAETAALPFLAGITHLSARLQAVDRGGVTVLTRSDYVTRLRGLDLSMGAVDGDCLIALLTSPGLGGLRNLILRYARIDDLRRMPAAVSPALRGLDLAFTPIGDAGLGALLTCRSLAGLEHLQLAGTRVGNGGALAIAAARHLRGLRFLGLEETAVTDNGAWALGRGRHLRSLTRLHLPAGVSDGAARKLQRSLPTTLVDVCGRASEE